MSSGPLYGIDISHSQGTVDFAQVQGAGFRFCIAKATEGADYEDPAFATNMKAIAALGAGNDFFAGAYHFGRPDNRSGRSGGETEATWFCDVLDRSVSAAGLSLASGFLEPALDLEKYDDSGSASNIEWVEGFLDVVAQRTGRKGMIYAGSTFWGYQMGNTDQFATQGIPLWQVEYSTHGSNPSSSPSRMPSDTSKQQWSPTLWQWSGGGSYAHYQQQFGNIPGIPGGVADVERVMGDESTLLTLAAASSSPSKSPPNNSAHSFSELPIADLTQLRSRYSSITARVQGLLLSQDFGPSGLVSSSTGRPDGISGPNTEAALSSFKAQAGLPSDTAVDSQTWWALVDQNLA